MAKSMKIVSIVCPIKLIDWYKYSGVTRSELSWFERPLSINTPKTKYVNCDHGKIACNSWLVTETRALNKKKLMGVGKNCGSFLVLDPGSHLLKLNA